MAITRAAVTAINPAGGSFTLPAHVAGDLLLIWAFNGFNSTAQEIPVGWKKLALISGQAQAFSALAMKIATSSSEPSGVWPQAEELIAVRISGFDNLTPSLVPGVILGVRQIKFQVGNSTVITFPAFDLPFESTTQSWVFAFAGSKLATNVELAPTGLTNLISSGNAAGEEIAAHDSNGPLASWSAQTVTVNTSAAWAAIVVEVVVLTPGQPLRVSQEAVEVLSTSSDPILVSQFAVEVLTNSESPPIAVSQFAVEVLTPYLGEGGGETALMFFD